MPHRSRSQISEPSAAAVSVLIDLLVDVLPPLQARVRTHRLEPFAKRLAQLTDPRDFAREEQPALRLATLAALIVRVVKELQVEIAEHDRHVAAHVDAYSRASSEEARRVRMDLMIDETAPTPRAARLDRQALTRFLDLDAMRERYALIREELVIMAELGIIAVGPAIAKAMESESISASTSFVVDVSMGIESEVRMILGQVEPVMFLVEQLSIVRRWPTRLACVESLEAVLSYLGPPRSKGGRGHRGESPHRAVAQMLRVLRTVGMDRSEHEWVQARALSCLRIVDSDTYRECVVERLALTEGPDWTPEWSERDFLTRGLLIDQLAHQLNSKADALMLERAIERGEASEFVRITHAKALEHLAISGYGFFARLARLLTRTPGDVDRQAEDEQEDEEDLVVPRTQTSSSQWLAAKPSFPNSESGEAPLPDRAEQAAQEGQAPREWRAQTEAGLELPRVHGSACIAMTQALGHIGRGTKARKHGRVIVERLAATIAEIDDPLVARIACEMAPIACAHIAENKGLRRDLDRSTKRLVEALKRCLADPTRSASIHEEASAAIEGIDQGARRDRSQWTEALREAIDRIPVPGEATLELPSYEGDRPSSAELARILPLLTRNDWGLDVDVRGDRMVVRRGDHKVSRMWRIMHEIRHHTGNKRQAYRHSVGRSFTGRLRAHAGRLDEVTMTVVPGERLHLAPEGGWGRHIPLVDDLIGMPWLRKGEASKVEIASSHGVTSLRLRGRLGQRLRARWRLNFKYAQLAELRRRTLMADEPAERRRYADELRDRYGIEMEFHPHPTPRGSRPVPPRLSALFPKAALVSALGSDEQAKAKAKAEAKSGAVRESSSGALMLGPAALAFPNLQDAAGEFMREHLHYLLTLEGNSQEALGYYALGLSAWFLGSGYTRRRVIANARAAIPLSVGGWGTRGKSGTERLKAGLFYALGFRIFSKTTGCEAMFIHAPPLGPQVEIFTFRPYGKATIWEQRNLLCLAAGLGSEVFMWECMALNPEYVSILQQGWMRDDLATITNTYPDHEDIQGPAGIDVATVIGNFIPQRGVAISSELGFNPVLRVAAADSGSELREIGDYEGDLLPDDLLALFPYAEHPRNIALVTEMARAIGIDGDLAIVCMADYVYPDLGVLKFYPDVVVRGRTLSFVNGCSANERAGFLNNWIRTGCVDISKAADPAKMVITVVNNRDDRISRSEVFSRILVNDAPVDAHVLIGTNLAGLQIFIDRALENFSSEIELVDAEGLASGEDGAKRARTRLRTLLLRVRAPIDVWREHLETLMRLGLGALGRAFEAAHAEPVYAHVERLRASEGGLELEAVVAKLSGDQALNQALRGLHDACAEDPSLLHPHEVNAQASYDEWIEHLRDRIARMLIGARLSTKLEAVLASRDAAALAGVTAELASAWTALFRGQLITVWDSGATGDQIIDQCGRAVPPGVHVTVMGTQNIKGTGLDFIYRWQALDAVYVGLQKLESDNENVRLEALRALDGHSDFGFTDSGLMVKRLPEYATGGAQEVAMRAALIDKASKVHAEKLKKLGGSTSGASAKGGKFWTWIEGWIDFMDGAVRYHQSRQLVDDLIHYRVSHSRMAVEMRAIYARAKGGWLGKALKAKLQASLGRGKAAELEEGEEDEPTPALPEASAEQAGGSEAPESSGAPERAEGSGAPEPAEAREPSD